MSQISAANTLELLKRLPLLADLLESDLVQLANQTRLQHYERDQVIFYQGDPCERVWVVHSGRVKIVFHDRDGREIILEMILPGEAFGGAVLFFPVQPATAIALEDAVVANFSAEVYSDFLLTRPQVTLKLLKMLGARHHAMLNMQVMAGERVERRMAHILLKLSARVGRETPEGTLITISLSRQDLADMACTTLETSIRTISRFQKDGMVATRRGGYLLVKDEESLKKLTD